MVSNIPPDSLSLMQLSLQLEYVLAWFKRENEGAFWHEYVYVQVL